VSLKHSVNGHINTPQARQNFEGRFNEWTALWQSDPCAGIAILALQSTPNRREWQVRAGPFSLFKETGNTGSIKH